MLLFSIAMGPGCGDPATTSLESRHRYAVQGAAGAVTGPSDGGDTSVAGADTEPELTVTDSGAATPPPDTAPADAIPTDTPVEATSPPDTTTTVDDSGPVGPSDVDTNPCPADMIALGPTCMDRWEAPNVEGELPLVMYTFYEAAAWCEARDKRLCFDDEWLAACAGDDGFAYPYGNVREPGRCNDDKIWRVYSQTLLNGWPYGLPTAEVSSLEELMELVSARSTAAAAAADHVLSLYQGTAAGARPDCVGDAGVEDLVGNVEEWVRRRDGGSGTEFLGALVGRYWAESRTCQSRVTVHGNAFRFYEIGFRCCRDLIGD